VSWTSDRAFGAGSGWVGRRYWVKMGEGWILKRREPRALPAIY